MADCHVTRGLGLGKAKTYLKAKAKAKAWDAKAKTLSSKAKTFMRCPRPILDAKAMPRGQQDCRYRVIMCDRHNAKFGHRSSSI